MKLKSGEITFLSLRVAV
uniref:Uncharacterized protein n=1 Tax=Rhizophora mucronata TaxID=61149 RepID=A0A2P2Q2B1_RHIMU